MMKAPKKPHKYENPEQKPADPESGMDIRTIIGIVLTAGGLWNIPSILKVPVTREDWMMLVIILAMIIGGTILLVIQGKKG